MLHRGSSPPPPLFRSLVPLVVIDVGCCYRRDPGGASSPFLSPQQPKRILLYPRGTMHPPRVAPRLQTGWGKAATRRAMAVDVVAVFAYRDAWVPDRTDVVQVFHLSAGDGGVEAVVIWTT